MVIVVCNRVRVRSLHPVLRYNVKVYKEKALELDTGSRASKSLTPGL